MMLRPVVLSFYEGAALKPALASKQRSQCLALVSARRAADDSP
jgi:hypothetical protein